MPEWKNGECRRLIAARYGEEVAKTADPAIESVQWKIMIAGYHAEESNKLVEPFTSSWGDVLRCLYAESDEGRQRFHAAAIKSEAHLIACAAAIHSLADIMAQVVFMGTGLPPDSVDENRRSFHSVTCALGKAKLAPTVLSSLEELNQSDSFRYVQAYVNTTKHRSLVSTQLSMNWERQGFKVVEFRYKDSVFPATWFDTVADEYRTSVGALIVGIGSALNEWLIRQV